MGYGISIVLLLMSLYNTFLDTRLGCSSVELTLSCGVTCYHIRSPWNGLAALICDPINFFFFLLFPFFIIISRGVSISSNIIFLNSTCYYKSYNLSQALLLSSQAPKTISKLMQIFEKKSDAGLIILVRSNKVVRVVLV